MKNIIFKSIALITVCVFLAQTGYAESKYKVELISFGDLKLSVIKAVKKSTGMGLVDAKKLVERAPCTIKEDLTKEQAAEIFSILQEAGAEVKIEDMTGSEYTPNEAELSKSPEKEPEAQIIQEKDPGEKSAEESKIQEKEVKKEPAKSDGFSVVFMGSEYTEDNTRKAIKQIMPNMGGTVIYLMASSPPGTLKKGLDRSEADEMANNCLRNGLKVIVVPDAERPEVSKDTDEYKEAKKVSRQKKIASVKHKKKASDLEEGELIKLTDIKIFEAAKGYDGPLISPPFLSKRDYNITFSSLRARHIYIELDLENPYDDKTYGNSIKYKIKVRIYGPDGILWDDQSDSVSVKSGKKARSPYFMFGWDLPGNWPAGTYRVEVLIDGKEEGEKEFTILADNSSAPKGQDAVSLYKIRFFDAGDKAPPEDERKYEEKFPRSTAKNIYTEVKLRNLLYGKKEGKYTLERVYYKTDGSELCRNKKEGKLDPKKSVITDLWGWGTDAGGNWWTGDYIVKVFLNGVEVSNDDWFKVYNDLVRGDSHIVNFDKMEFYEGEANAKDPGSYTDTFNSSEARYIYVKPIYKNLMYHDKASTYDIKIIYKDPQKKEFGKINYKMEVNPDWKTCRFSKGWGKKEPGFWKPGEYEVAVSGKGAGKGVGKFTVK
ncbi:ribosomal protein L7/L12 [Candidatus Omnitrophota bacterium]